MSQDRVDWIQKSCGKCLRGRPPKAPQVKDLVFIQLLVRHDLRDTISATSLMTKNYYDDMRQAVTQKPGNFPIEKSSKAEQEK